MKNPIDAVVGFFNPQAGLKRARSRNAIRIYEGAAPGRRSTSFRARHTSANSELQYAIRPLRDRSRELCRNTPHAPRAIDIITSHAIGTGLIPAFDTGSDKLDDKCAKLWSEWCAESDAEGVLNFNAQTALALHSTIESGEVVARLVDVDKGKNRKSKIPFRVQMLEADFIDQWREGIYGLDENLGLTSDTLRSRLGVGLGEYDFRTGLWILPWHPGEITTYNMRPGVSKFVARENIIHMFRVLRPGQVRGVPWFAPVLMSARDLADFMDAVTVKARVEACFAAFVTNGDEYDPLTDPASPDSPAYNAQQYDVSNPNAAVTTLEPGMIKELKSGQEVTFAQPSQGTQIEPVLMFNLMSFASGVGITYDQLSGDLRNANYSSLRAGKLDFKKMIDMIQNHTVIPQFCDRVKDRFIDRAILVGELKDRKGGYPVTWVKPAWESVNPKFDQDAEERSVRAGRQSPQDFIASWGGNWRKLIKDTAAFYKEAYAAGLVFDIDASKTSRAGQSQPNFSAAPPAPAGYQQSAPPIDDNGDEITANDDDPDGGDRSVVPSFLRPRAA